MRCTSWHGLAGEAVDEARVPGINQIAKQPIARRNQGLPEMKGVKVKRFHLADGVASPFVDRNPQRGSRRSDGILRRVLAEVLEARERPGAFLYLIEDDERDIWRYAFACLKLKRGDETGNVETKIESLAHPGVVVQIHVSDVLELRAAERRTPKRFQVPLSSSKLP